MAKNDTVKPTVAIQEPNKPALSVPNFCTMAPLNTPSIEDDGSGIRIDFIFITKRCTIMQASSVEITYSALVLVCQNRVFNHSNLS